MEYKYKAQTQYEQEWLKKKGHGFKKLKSQQCS